jgi:hypothetical protein
MYKAELFNCIFHKAIVEIEEIKTNTFHNCIFHKLIVEIEEIKSNTFYNYFQRQANYSISMEKKEFDEEFLNNMNEL